MNFDHLTKAHRLRSLADLIDSDPRMMAELEQLGVSKELMAGYARWTADQYETTPNMD